MMDFQSPIFPGNFVRTSLCLASNARFAFMRGLRGPRLVLGLLICARYIFFLRLDNLFMYVRSALFSFSRFSLRFRSSSFIFTTFSNVMDLFLYCCT